MSEELKVMDEPKPAAAPSPKPVEQPKLATELQQMQYEPLLPIEKKLIIWSIGLGVALLAALVWVSNTFFPGGAGH